MESIINEKLFLDVFGIAGASVVQDTHVPAKEGESIKKSESQFSFYRQDLKEERGKNILAKEEELTPRPVGKMLKREWQIPHAGESVAIKKKEEFQSSESNFAPQVQCFLKNVVYYYLSWDYKDILKDFRNTDKTLSDLLPILLKLKDWNGDLWKKKQYDEVISKLEEQLSLVRG